MASLFFDSPISTAIRRIVALPLSPLVSGPLLLATTFAPETSRDVLSSVLSTPIGDGFIVSAKFTLSALVGVGIVRWLNQGLNSIASNSWHVTTRNEWDWANEIAVVTGGSSGIGQSVVQRLADLGARVAILDIQPPLDKEFQSNPRIRFYECDITSTESITAAADAIRRDLGHPTILINNAGVTNPGPILTISESSLRKLVGVNLMSHWFTTQEFLPRMLKLNKGHIITVASVASFIAIPGAADYSATKAGVLAFHEALTTEIRKYHKAPGVLTTVVHPGWVRTPLIAGVDQRLEEAGVPLLDSGRVAGEIVSRIKSGWGGQLIVGVPSALSGLRGWPLWVQEMLRDMMLKHLT